jgi:hypothetical protein
MAKLLPTRLPQALDEVSPEVVLNRLALVAVFLPTMTKAAWA